MGDGMEASMCYCDYEPFDFYHVEMPKARKQHICCECGCEIQPGEQYERAVGKYEGVTETYKTCLTCTQIRKDYCAPYRGMREVLWEALGVDYVTGEQAYKD